MTTLELVMRKAYQTVLKPFLQEKLLKVKNTYRYTNEQMAEILEMDPRSYADLSKGKSCMSSVTLILFLLRFCDDKDEFFVEVMVIFKRTDEIVT